ncbi:MAG: DNA starvation/stationary phase protection protein [Ferruginibacter sp.]|nr:DNA starvation/stationary phase protection protein [Chitinophagaceae bacterium]
MTPQIGLSAKNLKSVTQLLCSVLSDAMLLYTKTRKFHWNVSGNSFMELHKLFEEQYKKLEESIDEIAERINKLGAKTPGTMQEFLQMTSLKESPGKYPRQTEMIRELLGDHEAVIIRTRKFIDDCDEKYKDKGSSDFLTDLLKEHETIAWTLRRYLQ